MRLVNKSLTESIYNTVSNKKLNESVKSKLTESTKIWSTDQEEEYWNSKSLEELKQEYIEDYGEEEDVNGVPLEDATEEDFLNFFISEDYNGAYEDFREAVMPEIEKQCVGDILVFYGEAANWHNRGQAAKAINISEADEFFFPPYEAVVSIIVDNGNLFFREASHDVPTGFTMGMYSFKTDEDFMKAEKVLKKYFKDEDFDMYYFVDYADFKSIDTLINEGLLTPIKNTINNYTGNEEMNESSVYGITSKEDAVNRAVQEMFDAMTDDMFVGDVSFEDDETEGKIKFNVVAYGGEPDENGDSELSRDVVLTIPYDYPDGKVKEMSSDEFYETAGELIKNWIKDHNSPDTFYESVMINTGSTTVTSDETGVTVEDNGNVITSGNGVNISIDNEADVIPTEDIQPEVLPDETASEEIPTEEPLDEVPTEEPSEDEMTEEVLEAPTEENKEEINNSKIEEADGYNQNQNVEIYQNPEFDYNILDITELDNVDSGDVRAIDMATILASLDESLTEKFGTENWGEINSFVTRKGTHKKTNESYASAILELSLPRLNESVGEYKNVLILEVYGDKSLKECIVRDSKSAKIQRFCGKSKNPAKHFESVILDIMNGRIMTEEVVPMVNEPRVKEKDIHADDAPKDERISKIDKKEVERAKEFIKRFREVKKFKTEEEPNQKYKLEKAITEAADELIDEPDVAEAEDMNGLEESGTEVAIFHRKPASVDAMKAAEANGITVNKSNYKVIGTKELSSDEFNNFANHLTSGSYEWLKDYANDTTNSGMFSCVEVKNSDDDSYSILVDPQGYDYARYAAIKENLGDEEELLDEPIDSSEEPEEIGGIDNEE